MHHTCNCWCRGISKTLLTLLVKKNGVPDLTMVDLPGITRVPVHGQPENIYDQIKDMIMEYIKPEQSIILNVLSATVDFTTCESIRMSQSVDKTGERTLAVVTMVDKAPEGLLEKVTTDEVNIGLGYVCVRNRIGAETYKEALAISDQLFQTHPLLSRIDESIVGIHVLAQKLVQIQASSIARNLPDIVKKINDKLSSCLSELDKMPKKLSSVADAMTAFINIIGVSKESLSKILIRGEFDEYQNEKHMHCTARLVEMLNQYADELHKANESDPKSNFLTEEIKVLEEAKVRGISSIPIRFVEQVWSYIGDVVISVLMHDTQGYYHLHMATRRAGHNLISKMKERSNSWILEIVEMEKRTDFTCNPEYVSEWNRLMNKQNAFIDGIEFEGLRKHTHVDLSQAFDLKMRMTAYWKVVLRRLVDCMALHLQLTVANLVNKEMELEIGCELMGANHGVGIERMLEEAPSVAVKREKLNKSIKKLKDSKEVVGKILDTYAG
ncbi:hypothetical protein PRUPE_2G039500 [Prunus persica]|uniref:GED domain-containing protein n=1 Tax=Prunus persica TaxID=3760 RepID=M5XMX0_PRUPE|nr:hypothetical protein PRUPE_2G039500 [Prunus persica]